MKPARNKLLDGKVKAQYRIKKSSHRRLKKLAENRKWRPSHLLEYLIDNLELPPNNKPVAPRKLDAAKIYAIGQRVEHGEAFRSVAAAFGLSLASVQRAVHGYQQTTRKTRNVQPLSVCKRVKHLRAEGLTYNQVSTKLKLGTETVRRIDRGEGNYQYYGLNDDKL